MNEFTNHDETEQQHPGYSLPLLQEDHNLEVGDLTYFYWINGTQLNLVKI